MSFCSMFVMGVPFKEREYRWRKMRATKRLVRRLVIFSGKQGLGVSSSIEWTDDSLYGLLHEDQEGQR
jgi:hypothetical protein